jgi:hypothetical protein
MTPAPLAMALVFISAAALAAGGACLVVLLHAKALIRRAALRSGARHEEIDATLSTLRDSLDGLAQRLEAIELRPAGTATSAAPGPGLSLTMRTQALRLHRRGDSPQQIAAALSVPVQDVDLLVKVHRILFSNV